MKLWRERFDFVGALDGLAAEFPGEGFFLGDMRLYAAVGKDRRKLRRKPYGEEVIAQIRNTLENNPGPIAHETTHGGSDD